MTHDRWSVLKDLVEADKSKKPDTGGSTPWPILSDGPWKEYLVCHPEDAARIKALHPELQLWSLAAVDHAWGCYSTDVMLVSWMNVGVRDTVFLKYLHAVQLDATIKGQGYSSDRYHQLLQEFHARHGRMD
jgi:hypothetical protein